MLSSSFIYSGLTCLCSSSHFLSLIHPFSSVHSIFFFHHLLRLFLPRDRFVFMFFFSFFPSLPLCWFVIGCLVLCGNICPPDLSVDIPYAVGSSLWSLGSGSAPPGPPAPGRLHRSISWAGTVHHVCHCAFSENTWCSVFLLTCTIHWSSSTNPIIVTHH